MAESSECVKVAVRCRPLNSKEKDMGAKNVIKIEDKLKQVLLQKDGNVDDNRNFTYDFVYGIDSNQQQVYDDSAFGLVESVLEGYNGTIFAYG